MSAMRPIPLFVLLLVLALLASAAPGQSGEEPTIVSVGNVTYMNATNYWFGSGFPGAPGAVPLGYTFIEPAHWNGHVLVSIVSGGYRSTDVEEIYDSTAGTLATGFYNQALPNLRLGFKVVFLTHGDAASPDDLSTPHFIVREIRDQIHEGLSQIRANELDARGGLIGVGGGSSGGALVMELMTKPRLNGSGVTSEPDLGIAVDAPVDLFNWRFSGDHGGFYQFGAQAVHPDISGNGSFPVPGPDPDLPGLRAELFPSGTPGVSNNIGQWTVERGNPQVPYSNGPEAFPHRNWDEMSGTVPTWGVVAPKAADFLNGDLYTAGGMHPGGTPADYPSLNSIAALPVDNVFNDLKPTTNPVLMTGSAEDEIVPYPQFTNFISQVLTSPLLAQSDFLTAFRYYANLDVDHGGRGDEDREALAIASAFRCEHLLGQMDGDFDLLDEGLEAFHGTNTHDPDTDGDGMLDGCEVIASNAPLSPATVFSDPLDPADGLRVSAIERIASQTVRVTGFMPGLNPNSSDYCIQTGTNLNTNASQYSWIDICPFSPSFTMNQRTFDLTHAPLSAGESIYFRIRRDSTDFDMASCDPVGLKAVEIQRDPAMSVTNYIGASLIPREARGKVASVTSSGGTATVHLERPLGFNLQEGIRDIVDGQDEWALVVIRDPANQPEELLNRYLTPSPDYELPDRQEVGLEGHWWLAMNTSGGLPNPPTPVTSTFGDTAIEVQLRVGAGLTNATDLTPGCTVALRKLATVEQALGGPVGSPGSPFKTGDIIRLYQRDGIITALDGNPLLPVATANFLRHELTFSGGAWVENGNAVSLADFTLHPDECFEYVAAPGTTSDVAVMAGWVPMADIKAYLPGIPTVDIDGHPVAAIGVNIIKHFPYPEDCRERITETSPIDNSIAVPSMGLIESGINYASECTLQVPWPIGVAPPTVPFVPGDNQGFWYTFSTEDQRTSDFYWGDPKDPYWYISDDRHAEPDPELNWVNTLRPFLQGPVLPSGRGRIVQRFSHPDDPDSDDDDLVEWGRRRPYPWRM